jgi:ATP-dependent helicase HrpA
MTFRVEDERGAVVAEGQDLEALRAAVRPKLRAELAGATRALERTGLRDWTIGDLPRAVALPGTGQAVRAYPALVDEGDGVAVRALDTPAAQEAAMRAGTRRLLLLTVPSPARRVRQSLGNAAQLTLAAAPHGSLDAVVEDAVVATVDALVEEAGGPAWDAAGFARLRDHVAAHLAPRAQQVVGNVVTILDAARGVQRRADALTAPPLRDARADVERQLHRLVHPGFVAETGLARLPDVLRYLQGAARRLDRLPDAVAVDRDKLRAIAELERAYHARLRDGQVTPELRDVHWMLEELRVAQFAQGLGTRGGPVSAKRVRRVIDEA